MPLFWISQTNNALFLSFFDTCETTVEKISFPDQVNPSSFPFLQGMKDFFLFFFSHPPVKDTEKTALEPKIKCKWWKNKEGRFEAIDRRSESAYSNVEYLGTSRSLLFFTSGYANTFFSFPSLPFLQSLFDHLRFPAHRSVSLFFPPPDWTFAYFVSVLKQKGGKGMLGRGKYQNVRCVTMYSPSIIMRRPSFFLQKNAFFFVSGGLRWKSFLTRWLSNLC